MARFNFKAVVAAVFEAATQNAFDTLHETGETNATRADVFATNAGLDMFAATVDSVLDDGYRSGVLHGLIQYGHVMTDKQRARCDAHFTKIVAKARKTATGPSYDALREAFDRRSDARKAFRLGSSRPEMSREDAARVYARPTTIDRAATSFVVLGDECEISGGPATEPCAPNGRVEAIGGAEAFVAGAFLRFARTLLRSADMAPDAGGVLLAREVASYRLGRCERSKAVAA